MIRASLFSDVDFGLSSCCLRATNEAVDGDTTRRAQAQALACMVQAANEIMRVANEQRNAALLLSKGTTMAAAVTMNLCSPIYYSVRVIGGYSLLAFLTIDGGSTAALSQQQAAAQGQMPVGFEGTAGFNLMPMPGEAKSKLAETAVTLTILARMWPVAGQLAVESAALWEIASRCHF